MSLLRRYYLYSIIYSDRNGGNRNGNGRNPKYNSPLLSLLKGNREGYRGNLLGNLLEVLGYPGDDFNDLNSNR